MFFWIEAKTSVDRYLNCNCGVAEVGVGFLFVGDALPADFLIYRCGGPLPTIFCILFYSAYQKA